MTSSPKYFKELYRYKFDDLYVGQFDVYSHTITETDIRMFAALSGDNNPIHLDKEFCKKRQIICVNH